MPNRAQNRTPQWLARAQEAQAGWARATIDRLTARECGGNRAQAERIVATLIAKHWQPL